LPARLDPVPPAAPAQSVAAWEEAMQRCRQKIAACGEQAARQLEQQAALQTQVASQERLVEKATGELDGLRQRMADAVQSMQALEMEHAAQLQKLSALSECQAVSQTLRMAEQEVQAHVQMTARLAEFQQGLGEELARYQQRGQQLQRAADVLRAHFEQALAKAAGSSTPPTDAPTTPTS
jgi:hypothetical protein